ncbi:MAG: acyltransferase family protein [Janthinobacterium lividum]
MTHAPRNAGLDLLRCLAILCVLVSHVGQAVPWWFGWRWGQRIPAGIGGIGSYGVTLFFVLSGFLVGGIALRAMRPEPTWRTVAVFLTRRWMRTVPLYYVALAVFLATSPPAAHLAAHVVRYATFTQNLLGDMPPDHWFSVSWSLTVEEWFYLLFGLCGLGLATRLPAGAAAWIMIVLLAAVPTWLRWTAPSALYFAYADPLWFDALAFGVAVARITQQRRVPPAAAVLAGLAGAWCAGVVLTNRLILPLAAYNTLMPTVMASSAALLLPLAMLWRTGSGRLSRAIAWVSTRSYGLYLFHFAVLGPANAFVVHQIDAHPRYGATGVPGWTLLATIGAVLVLPCAMAELGHRLVERPFMRLRPRQ